VAEWPEVYRVDYGQEEAAARFGADPRQFGAQAKRFLGDERGRVTAVETVEVDWVGEAAASVDRWLKGSRPE
jgi:glutamate synthase (NADPH/NADH) small chain